MTISFDTAACRNFDNSISAEWLLTNGLGGYASGTVAGANTRKYHGLLVVAAHPPVQRYVVLSRVEDRIVFPTGGEGGSAGGGGVFDLSTDEFADIIHPQGYKSLISFELAHGPVWRFQAGDAVIEKSITLVHGQDTVIVRYALISNTGNVPVKLQLQPMLAGRDFHATIQLNQRPWWTVSSQSDGALALSAPECPVKLFFTHNADKFNVNACWWYNFTFRVERQRGYPDREDLWTPGVLEYTLTPNTPVGFIASTKSVLWSDHAALIQKEKERHQKLAVAFAAPDAKKKSPAPNSSEDLLSKLSLAADQFIVQRGETSEKKSVIAGYPWFEDWGRDTFISLPGLALVTGRFDVAKSILSTFADHMRRGCLPNRFPDKAFTPDYNTVDASMWFVHAAYQYWRYTGDLAFLTKYLYPKLCEIMESYRDGTDFGIRMDHDSLIRAGDGNHQPTWMDAKIGDWVVTPRHGKPVEINALWYSNLRVMALLAERANDPARAVAFTQLAERVQQVYEKTYWNASQNCLFDVIGDDGGQDGSIRPNQLLAVALPFSPLTEEAQRGVVAVCQKQLLTPMGMRTLAPGSPQYHGRCTGDQRARDMAYHQGTVWPWLIGPFVSAYVKVRGSTDAARKEAAAFIEPFKAHLLSTGLGSISEIADGDAPHTPRGCPAQAWSVAEVLRVFWEDIANKVPAWPHTQQVKKSAVPV